jgi:hypothetical protein
VCQSCSTQAVPKEHFLKCDVRCGNSRWGRLCCVSISLSRDPDCEVTTFCKRCGQPSGMTDENQEAGFYPTHLFSFTQCVRKVAVHLRKVFEVKSTNHIYSILHGAESLLRS